MWGELTDSLTTEQKNEAGNFQEIRSKFYNRICAPDRDVYAGDVMLYYLRHLNKPCKMSPRDFSARWNEMLQHMVLLEKNYKGHPNEADRKLMYMRAYPKSYHQKF